MSAVPKLAVPFRMIRNSLATILCLLSIVWLSGMAVAQSCALCYTQAASSGSRIIHGLRSGILVLVIPPLFMSIGITILAYRKRNRFTSPPSVPKNSKSDW